MRSHVDNDVCSTYQAVRSVISTPFYRFTLLSACAAYLLKLLRSQGLPIQQLHMVFAVLIFFCIIYALLTGTQTYSTQLESGIYRVGSGE